MTIVEIFSIIEAVGITAASTAACFSAYIAYSELGKRRKDLIYKTNFEVALTLQKAVYRVRNELGYARSAFYSTYEFPEGYSRGQATAEEEAAAWEHIYLNRWKPVSKAIQNFEAALLEAEALWGDIIKEKGLKFLKTTNELYNAMEAIVEDIRSGGKDFENSEQYGINTRKKLAASPSVDNPLSNDIDKAIKDLEHEVFPHLERR